MYDAIIVGARCAGSPTAMQLARKNYKVLLLDRTTFPSNINSTHFIWQSGVARLQKWDLLDDLRATECPAVTKMRLDLGDIVLTGCPVAAEGGTREAFGPRRTVIDTILVNAAAASGVEVREAFSVQELVFEDDRVTGIRGAAKGGSTVTEHARIVIGADGGNSTVAKAVGASKTLERPMVACGFYSYWSGLRTDGAELYVRRNRTIIRFPTNDDLTCLIAIAPASEFAGYRADVERTYMSSLDQAPTIAEAVRSARREEPFMGGIFSNFFRKPFGPGWALVGDAGYLKDPYSAQGISDAFRDSELLTDALDAAFSGRRNFDEALADYERLRNETAMPAFESNIQRASHTPPPRETIELFRALQGNQEQIDRFFGVDAGTVPYADFFSPENIQKIMSRSTSKGA